MTIFEEMIKILTGKTLSNRAKENTFPDTFSAIWEKNNGGCDSFIWVGWECGDDILEVDEIFLHSDNTSSTFELDFDLNEEIQ